MPPYLYFGVEWAIKEHDKIIAISGGRSGELHRDLLESALDFIQNDDYYPDIVDKLTHLVYSIAKNHCFVDGNKRSSIALGAYFLEINGYQSLVTRFIVEMENIVLWVASDLLSKDDLWNIINDLVKRGELSVDTKLNLLDVLQQYNELVAHSGLNGESPTKAA